MAEAEVLVKYKPGPALIPLGAVCGACGAAEGLVRDHCHEHGWVRGIVCRRCNRRLGHIDQRFRPRGEIELLISLLAVRNRCPDRDPVGIDDLTPVQGP